MRRIGLILALAGLTAGPVGAHHEAIFGPQSALVLSSDAYFTAQLFTRQTGPQSDRQQETTTILSGGVTPFRDRALSFSLVLPFSTLSQNGSARTGLENAIVGVRYRADVPAITTAIGGRESFAMAVGGVELPSGTLDHAFGEGAFAAILAGLLSVEKGPFSAIGYGFYRRPGTHQAVREGGNVFWGGGLAWTPLDDEGRLFSLQLGLSHETTLDAHVNDIPLIATGGSGVFAHPTVLYGRSQRLLFFAQTTVPIQQAWDAVASHERFRVGAGVIVKVGR